MNRMLKSRVFFQVLFFVSIVFFDDRRYYSKLFRIVSHSELDRSSSWDRKRLITFSIEKVAAARSLFVSILLTSCCWSISCFTKFSCSRRFTFASRFAVDYFAGSTVAQLLEWVAYWISWRCYRLCSWWLWSCRSKSTLFINVHGWSSGTVAYSAHCAINGAEAVIGAEANTCCKTRILLERRNASIEKTAGD